MATRASSANPGHWHVQRYYESLRLWVTLDGAQGAKSYVEGWFDALTSHRHLSTYRIVSSQGVVQETRMGHRARLEKGAESGS